MKRVLMLILILATSACTYTAHARLYDLQAATVLRANYKYNGIGHGAIWIGDNEKAPLCKGEYVTVPHGADAWGAIYGLGGSAVVATSLVESDQTGRAIATCTDGRVIECEYVTSALTAAGHGSCRDNQSHLYRLMF